MSFSIEEEPNHIVVWFDPNFSNPNEYRILKRTIANNTDPRYPIADERIFGLLYVFGREDDFFGFLQQNENKRIFIITSGTLGRIIVPKIIEKYRQLFTNPSNNHPYSSIYILCHDVAYEMDWAEDYLDYILTFDFDTELLEYLTRDIADHYVEQGTRLRQDRNYETALRYLHWAMRLYFNYDIMQRRTTRNYPYKLRGSKGRSRTYRLIEEIELERAQDSNDNDAEAEPSS